MSRALISFLGTSDYVECRYSLDNKHGSLVKYVQEDMADRFCRNWDKTDQIRIFTTTKAKQTNWVDNGHTDYKTHQKKENPGLKKRLALLNLPVEIHQIDIPEGNSEEEIWKIFRIIYETMEENEEIIFDMTHSFRSIPMLFMVLTGYSEILKKIDISGVYYGAFEVLGTPYDVLEKIKNPEDRVAQIFDLTSFIELNRWTQATQSFIRHGISSGFQDLVRKKTSLALQRSKGRDQVAQNMNYLEKSIGKISQNILYNRGYDIITSDYEKTLNNLQRIRQDPSLIPPFTPLIEKIEEKIRPFEKYDVKNGFHAVDWCVAHGLIQQAVTMLWENIITWVLETEGLDWSLKVNRKAASDALHFLANPKYSSGQTSISELVAQLQKNKDLLKISGLLAKLRVIRNDINHGGYKHDENDRAKSAESLKQDFDTIYIQIYNFLKYHDLSP